MYCTIKLIIFLLQYLRSSVFICIVLQVPLSQWSKYFAPLLSVSYILIILSVKTNLFLFSCFLRVLSWVPFGQLSTVLWFSVWYQYCLLLMLDYFWSCHFLRALHTVKQSIKKKYFLLIYIVLQVSFTQWSSYFSPLINKTRKIQHT